MRREAAKPQPEQVTQLAREVSIIRDTQTQLATALQRNTEIFADAFRMIDAQMHVLQRVTNDFCQGKAYQTESGGVDFIEYMSEYWGVMGFCDFIAAHKVHSNNVQPPVIAAPSEEEVHVFGG